MNTAKQIPITTYGMEILRKKTTPVKEIDSKLIGFIQDMFYTMTKASGIGLAAPQVNSGISLAVVDLSEIEEYKSFKPLILINPVVTEFHGKDTAEEGCLSIPDLRADVERHSEINLRYFDLNMNEINTELKGFPARVVQHEIDHLNGILFTDLLPEEKKKEFKRKLTEIKKGRIEAEYPLRIHSGKNGYRM
ncbi:MAG: Peptide deformylase 1 [Ignavibacteria bacterium]|nr:Peptide deformylase 1 [Ignavibacteria bacterium]